MAGKTYTQKIQFQGSFDGKEVLDGLKKIRQQMSDAGADASLFKGVDKDIADTEKLINSMLAQIQKGFSNPKEITAFEKQLEKLGLSFSKINVGLQGVNEAGNFNLNAAEVQKYAQAIEDLTKKQEAAATAAQASIAAQLDAAKLTKAERKSIMAEVEAQGDLEEAIIKVAQAKEKAAKARHGSKAIETQEGQDFIAQANVGLSLDDMGVAVKKGHSKKGTNDARIRSGGKLTGEVDSAKAAAAAQEAYQKALAETIKTGGSAVDTVEVMKEVMDEYGLELRDTSKLLEAFDNDMKSFNTTILSQPQQRAVSRAQHLGSTDAQGSFHLSQAGQDIVNNVDYQVATQAARDIEQAHRDAAKAAQIAGEQNEEMTGHIVQGLGEAKERQEEFIAATETATNETREMSEATQQLDNSFDNMKQAVKTFLSISSAVSAVRNVISETFETVKSLDKSFADIAMVTDYSVSQMWESYDSYAEMANELGQTTKSVIDASGLFYQQGLDTADSLALTEDTMKLATLSGLDFAEATSQMTAALRGFKMEMNEGSRVTDVYAELAAKAAADVEGISNAMIKTASIAESAGMEFETTSAFLTQMIETTQEAPANIGTAMKTIIARFTELKENVAGTDESAFDDLDYNKVDTALKSIGVSLKDSSGQFRDLDDVFLELSGKWETLDRNTQRYIATIAAGARQQSRFIAMMDNYDRTIELVDVAYDSAGKSSEQFGKYQDTLEYKLNQLSNTWEQFRTNFFDSDFFKGVIDGVHELVSLIENLEPEALIAVAALGVVIGRTFVNAILDTAKTAISGVKGVVASIFSNIGSKGSGYQADLTAAFAKKGYTQSGDGYQDKDGNVIDSKEIDKVQNDVAAQRGQALGQAFAVGFSATVTAVLTMDNPLASAFSVWGATLPVLLTQMFIPAAITAAKGSKTVGEAIGKGIKGGLNSTGVGLIITLILSAIAAIATGIKNMVKTYNAHKIENRLEEAKKMAEEATAAANDAKQAAKEAADEFESLKETKERFEELDAKAFLTLEEQEEYATLVEKIRTEMPEVVTYYNEITGELEVQNKLWDNIINKQSALAKEEAGVALSAQMNAVYADAEMNRLQNITDFSESIGVDAEIVEDSSLEELKGIIEGDLNTTLTDLSTGAKITAENLDIWAKVGDKSIEEFIKANTEYGESIDDFYELSSTEQYETLKTALDASIDSIEGEKQARLDAAEMIRAQAQTAYKDYFAALNPDATEFEIQAKSAILMSETIGEGDPNEYFKDMEVGFDDFVKQGGALYLASAITNAKYGNSVAQQIAEQDPSAKGVFKSLDDAFVGGTISLPSAKSLQNQKDKITFNYYDEEIERTGEEIFELFARNYESIAEAEEAWNELMNSALGQDEIIRKIYASLDQEKAAAVEKWAEDNATAMNTIENGLNDMVEEGVTQESIDEFKTYIDKLGGSEEVKAIVESAAETYQEQLNAAIEAARANNLDDDYVNTWTADQLNQYFTYIKGVGDKIGDIAGLIYSESFQESLPEYGELTDEIMGAMSSVDVDSINAFNIDEHKGQFIDNLKSIYEEAGKTLTDKEAEKIWSDFFNTAEQFNVIDLSLNVGTVETIEETVKEGIQNALDQTDVFAEAIKSQASGEGIGFELSTQLEEALKNLNLDPNEYLDWETGSPVLDIEKLKADYAKLAEFQVEEQIELAKQETEEKKDQLQTVLTLLEGGTSRINQLADELRVQQEITVEMMNQARILEAMGVLDKGVIDGIEISATEIEVSEADIDLAKQKIQEQIDNYDASLEELGDPNSDLYQKLRAQALMGITEGLDAMTEAEKEGLEELEESYEDAENALDSLNEAQQEYLETLHGTAEWLDDQDPFVALSDSISLLETELEGLQKQLEQVFSPDQAGDLLKQINANRATQIENLTAQMQISQSEYEQVLDFIQNGDYAKYYSQLPDGTISFNMAEWFKTGGSDEMGDALMEMAAKGNEAYLTTIENGQKIAEIEQEEIEDSEKRLQDFVSIQEDMLKILKENAEKEIETQKERYEALKEADDEYLTALKEAIDKQRELREQEQEYENLAIKERKLALLQRDTSGANQKEILSLQQEIEEDRESLLDNKIDSIVETLREQYELQAEQRDTEIEIKESLLESKNFLAELAAASNMITDGSDVVAWMIENDSEWENYTSEQQELKLAEWEELGNQWVQYLGEKENGYTTLLDTAEENVSSFAETGMSAITNSIQRIMENEEAAQAEREKEAAENLAETKAAYDEAIAKHNEYLSTLRNSEYPSNNLDDIATQTGTGAEEERKGKVQAKKSETVSNPFASTGIIGPTKNSTGTGAEEERKGKARVEAQSQDKQADVKTNLLNQLNDLSLSDWTHQARAKANALQDAFLNLEQDFTYYDKTSKKTRTLSISYKDILSELGINPAGWVWDQQELLTQIAKYAAKLSYSFKYTDFTGRQHYANVSSLSAYKTGGLVDYTGPAWVDGSKTKPEAFLSAEDTIRIGEAAKLLADLPILNSTSNAKNATSTNIGDTSIEIHINVENIDSDYDVDQMIERVKQDIVDVSKPIGSSVILKK